MRNRNIFLLLIGLLIVQVATAQNSRQNTQKVLKNYTDSLAILRQQLDAALQKNDSLQKELSDGRYYRLFAPATFYHSGANKSLSLSPETGDEVTDAIDKAMMNIYLRRPDLVRNTETRLQNTGSVRDDVNQEVKQDVELVEQVEPLPDKPEVVPVGIVVTKPNFWQFKFDGSLQVIQNYVSDNWYKGGESNYSGLGIVTLELNYNDKDRYTWENKLEMKLGFLTSPSDTVHKVKATNDLLRFTTKLGLQASKKWYYSLQLLAYTQFAKSFKANDPFVYSAFMSPFDLNIGLGMEYKLKALNGKLTGTLNFLPLAYNFRYMSRSELLYFYGMEGKHALHELGAQFTGDIKWMLTDNLMWKSRLYAYTAYHRSLIEWENQFEFKVTKYISANLFLYPRFDDSEIIDDDGTYWQFLEYCSLGLSYSF